MGEYAIRKSDGVEVKIGTCDAMYYSRYEQRNDVIYNYPIDNCFWRMPFPSEDGIEVGDYEFHRDYDCNESRLKFEFLSKHEGIADDAGIIQFREEKQGLLVNVPCYHGIKTPTDTDEVKFFFNGRSNPLRLWAVKNADEEMRIVVKCSSCEKMWSFDWNEIEYYIQDLELKKRLFLLCLDYYRTKHRGDKLPSYIMTDKRQYDKATYFVRLDIIDDENGKSVFCISSWNDKEYGEVKTEEFDGFDDAFNCYKKALE